MKKIKAKLPALKKKEKDKELPKPKVVTFQTGKRIVSFGAILLLVLSVIAVFRVNGLASNQAQMVEEIKGLQEISLVDNQDTKERVDFVLLSYYAQEFTKAYINRPLAQKSDAMKARDTQLEKFISFDLKMLEEKGEKDYSRQVKSMQVKAIDEQEDTFFVSLDVIYLVEIEKLEVEYARTLVVPIQSANGLFAVVSIPYFLQETLPFGRAEGLKQLTSTEVEKLDWNAKKKEDFDNFLVFFFGKYATGTLEEMAVLMKDPEISTDGRKLGSFDPAQVRVFEERADGVIGVQVYISFVDEKTSIATLEPFTLWLSKTETSYQVNTMKHYFTTSEK